MKFLKRFFPLLTILFLQLSAFAQEMETVPDSTATQTLFSKGSIKKIGLYVAPEIGVGQYGSAFTPIGSASAMLLINNKWAFGANVGRTIDRDFTPKGISGDNSLSLNVITRGLKVEYGFAANKVFHVTIPVSFGLGNFSIDSVNGQSSNDTFDFDHGHGNGHGGFFGRGINRNDNNHFGYITPGLNLELNVMKYARLFLGISYRIATGLKNNTIYNTVSTSDFSGVGLSLGAKIGLFEFNVRKDKS
jgi:hypothetical protein